MQLSLVKIGSDRVLLACIKLRVKDTEDFMNNLRSINRSLAVQIVNANLVAGKKHVTGIIQQSIEARKRKIMLSKRIEVDMLMRLACTDQISKAVNDIGIKDGINNVLIIAVGRVKDLRMFRKYIASNYHINNKILEMSSKKIKNIVSLHGIGKQELDLVDDGIASILVERASLL
jgi:tRNA threonylcarbamoyladenosine modification (KEOPS) complex Cgi121 subunit